MPGLSIGYDEAVVKFNLLSDGSKAWSVWYPGDNLIVFDCVDQQAAENLAFVINNSVTHVEVT